jgi:hypothetical protein
MSLRACAHPRGVCITWRQLSLAWVNASASATAMYMLSIGFPISTLATQHQPALRHQWNPEITVSSAASSPLSCP